MKARSLIGFASVAVTLFGYIATFAESSTHSVRVGMIGLDTSHVVAFTRIMNDPEASGALKDVHVVAAWPGGNPDFPLSRDRVQGFTRQVKDMGVEIVEFFKTSRPPVEPEETLEVFAFMEAAEESKRQDGIPISIAEVMVKARQSLTSLGVTPTDLINNR